MLNIKALPGLAVLMIATGCDDAAGGRPISFHLSVSAESSVPQQPLHTFVTSQGWNVQLEEACIALGPLYIFRAPSHLGVTQQIWSKFVPRAYAHVGDNHFGGGEVRGEWLGQVALNAMDPTPQLLGLNSGLEGPVQAYSLMLNRPGGKLAADPCLRGHHAWAAGVASRGDVVVPFEGGLQIENVGTNRQVQGLPLKTELDEGTQIQLMVRPAIWFDLADFASLNQQAPSGRFLITGDSQVHRTWFIGVRAPNAFAAVAHQLPNP